MKGRSFAEAFSLLVGSVAVFLETLIQNIGDFPGLTGSAIFDEQAQYAFAVVLTGYCLLWALGYYFLTDRVFRFIFRRS